MVRERFGGCELSIAADPGFVLGFFAVCVLQTTPEFKVVPDAEGRERLLRKLLWTAY